MDIASETCVRITNDGISAGWIDIDETDIFGSAQFNPHIHDLSSKLFLEKGSHELSLRLASKPGGRITIELLAGCSFEVDETIEPVVDTLPGYFDGEPAPVAAIADEHGQTSSFAANELIIQNDDPSVVERILDRYEGSVLYFLESKDSSGFHLPATYLIKVNVENVDINTLARDISYLTSGTDVQAVGNWRVSSLDGLKLLSAAAKEAQQSSGINLNFIGSMAAIPNSTHEAPYINQPSRWNNAYDPIDWKHFSRCDRHNPDRCWTVDTGVAEAWSLLYLAGRLDQGPSWPFVSDPVKIAVLDGGFTCVDPEHPNFYYPDYPTVETRNPCPSCPIPEPCDADAVNWAKCSDHDCPYHGTGVLGAALGIPDNMWGGAGPGGPVSTPILYFTFPDTAMGIMAIEDAVSNTDAKIINMSWYIWVPAIGGGLFTAFESTTSWAHWARVLIFASAGNDGKNVDDEDCFLGICWEPTWDAPCENDGVICVGGTNWDFSPDGSIKAEGSNYGREDVDLWAPWRGIVGPNPSIPVNQAVIFSGTSHSSPFAAGVAALVWKAHPQLLQGQVEDILKDTSNQFFDDAAGTMKGVNAYNAVLKAIGCQPVPEITFPADGQVFELNQPISSFQAKVTHIIDYSPVLPICLDVVEGWGSDIDGALGPLMYSTVCGRDYDGLNESESFLWNPTLSEGDHVISYVVTVRDSEGRTYGCRTPAAAQVRISVVNSAPYDITIIKPSEGNTFCAGQEVQLIGDAKDNNEDLPDNAFFWFAKYDDLTYPIGTGREVSTTDLAVGLDGIILQVFDDHGLTGTSEVAIQILPPTDPECSNLPPTAWIVTPADGDQFPFIGLDPEGGYYANVELSGDASDDHDSTTSLTFQWSSNVDGNLGEGQTVVPRLHVPDSCSQWHRITLRVTDTGGKYAEDVVNVLILGPECISGG